MRTFKDEVIHAVRNIFFGLIIGIIPALILNKLLSPGKEMSPKLVFDLDTIIYTFSMIILGLTTGYIKEVLWEVQIKKYSEEPDYQDIASIIVGTIIAGITIYIIF